MESIAPQERNGLLHRLYRWVLKWSAHRNARSALFGLAFAEASFFPIPPDVLLIAMAVARPAKARLYAALATLGSVTGGLAGYAIGKLLWIGIRDFAFRRLGFLGLTPDNFTLVERLYNENAFKALFAAGFTPIPFKVFTIAAGVFEVALPVFILASILGRSGRFFLVAELVRRMGPPVLPFIERHLGWLSLVFAALLFLGFYVIRFLH
jgi:membrane protein YqaA with SNARE-associated domain